MQYKGKRKLKQERRERGIAELKELKKSLGLTVWEFAPHHLRIIGKRAVDYWPSTGKAWITDDYGHRAQVMTPQEACQLAQL